jgi:hypothetical protein
VLLLLIVSLLLLAAVMISVMMPAAAWGVRRGSVWIVHVHAHDAALGEGAFLGAEVGHLDVLRGPHVGQQEVEMDISSE